MNINFGIGNKGQDNSIFAKIDNKNSLSEKLTGKLNNYIKATITEENDKTYTLVGKDDLKFTADKTSIKGNLGDELTFKVVKNDKNGINLKQVLEASSNKKAEQLQSKIIDVKEMFKKADFIEDDSVKNNAENEEKLKEQLALLSIKRQLSYASNNAGKTAIGELLASGISLEKISFDVLTTVMTKIEEKPNLDIKQSDLTKIINDYATIANKKAEISKSNKSENSNVSKDVEEILKSLTEKGLPITNKNVKNIEDVLAKADKIGNLDRNSITTLIRNNEDVTVENVYISKFSTKTQSENAVNKSEAWEKVADNVEKIFKDENIKDTKENKEAAKALFEAELPINKENIEKYVELSNLKINKNNIINNAINNIKKGINPAQISFNSNDINHELFNEYKDTITALPNITEETINIANKNNSVVTLNNLKEAVNSPVISNENVNNIKPTRNEESVNLITQRRQVIEIQMKLTIEASYRLTGKNININTMPLQDALDQLKELEKDMFLKTLSICGADTTTTNVEKMGDLFNKMTQIGSSLTSNVFKNIMSNPNDFSIDKMSVSISYSKTIETYETFATTPNAKFGDTLESVKSGYSDLLENLGITPTNDTIKAASILTKSQIDITYESLTEVKSIDSKIGSILKRLHPMIAANMVKDGLNPVDMHVDDVLEYVDKFNNIFGEDVNEKLANHIFEMDKNKTIDSTTRESVIAIYRMLNIIKKEDGVAVGLTVKKGSELTLGNLMESAQYYSRTKGIYGDVDFNIDDNFGSLEQLNFNEGNIRNTLNKTELLYNQHLVDDLIVKAKPNSLSEIIENSSVSEMFKEPIENINRNLDLIEKSIVQNDNINTESIKTVQNLTTTEPAFLMWMKKNNITVNAKNIESVKNLVENPNLIEDVFSEISENETLFKDLTSDMLDSNSFNIGDNNNIDNKISSLLEKIDNINYDITDINLLRNMSSLKTSFTIQQQVNQSSNNNSFPVKINDKIKNLNMYVMNENITNESTILLVLNTENIGTVQMYFKETETGVNVSVNSTENYGLEKLKNNEAMLRQFADDSGFNINNIEFVVNEKVNTLKEEIGV